MRNVYVDTISGDTPPALQEFLRGCGLPDLPASALASIPERAPAPSPPPAPCPQGDNTRPALLDSRYSPAASPPRAPRTKWQSIDREPAWLRYHPILAPASPSNSPESPACPQVA